MLDSRTSSKIAAAGKKDLYFFSRAILGFDKLVPHIHGDMCRFVSDHKTNTRVLIAIPRDWYKSTICSVSYPLWRIVNNPDVRILLVQNTFGNAAKKVSEIKQIAEKNELFKACYPEVLPPRVGARWSADCLEFNRKLAAPEGTVEPAGRSTAVTSRHFDLIIQDDTVSPDKPSGDSISLMQPTKLEIDKAIAWHKLCGPLLLDPLESQVVVVGTRWCESDLIGYVLETSPEYVHYIRGVLEKNGKPATRREGGVPIWDRYNDKVIEILRRDLGPDMFSCLMLNMPVNAENRLFNRDWILYYAERPNNLLVCTSVDPAPADEDQGTNPDYNVVLTTGIHPPSGRVYVLGLDRLRGTPSEVINAIFLHERLFHPTVVRIEAIAYQRTLCHWIQQKQKKLNRFFHVEEVPYARASKIERIKGLQPFFRNNLIFMKSDVCAELERELLGFPRAKHDDCPDALSMQISFWQTCTTYENAWQANRLARNPLAFDVLLEEVRNRHLPGFQHDMGNLCHAH